MTHSKTWTTENWAARKTDLHTHFSGILPFEHLANLYVNQIAKIRERTKNEIRGEGARDPVDAEKRILAKLFVDLLLNPHDKFSPLTESPSILKALDAFKTKWGAKPKPGEEDPHQWFKDGKFDKVNFWGDVRFWKAIPEGELNSLILRLSRGMPGEIPFDEVYALNTAMLRYLRDNHGGKAAHDQYFNAVVDFLRYQSPSWGDSQTREGDGPMYTEISLHHGMFLATERGDNFIPSGIRGANDIKVKWLAGLTNDYLWRPRDNDRSVQQRRELTAKITEILAKRGDVTGIDVFGGESHQLSKNPDGYDSFRLMYEVLADKARPGRKLVYRIHVGEGFAFSRTRTPLEENQHRAVAHDNIETVLNWIEKIAKDQKLDLKTSNVIFRLGHFTAATPEQVARAAKLGVYLEFPLRSNIATGALPRVGTNPNPLNPTTPSGLPSIFDNHPLLLAIHHEAKFSLASDGNTVSHSSMDSELRAMAYILARFYAGDVKINIGTASSPVLKTYSELSTTEKARFDNAFKTMNDNLNEYRKRVGQSAVGGPVTVPPTR